MKTVFLTCKIPAFHNSLLVYMYVTVPSLLARVATHFQLVCPLKELDLCRICNFLCQVDRNGHSLKNLEAIVCRQVIEARLYLNKEKRQNKYPRCTAAWGHLSSCFLDGDFYGCLAS